MDKTKRKPAIFFASEESHWISCKTITRNLIKAYHLNFGAEGLHHFRMPSKQEEVWKLASEVYEANPDRLIFVDHAPHPAQIIMALAIRYGRRKLPPIYFHVYGDFTLYPRDFLLIEDILKKTSTVFICASDRQVKLVTGFIYKGFEKNFIRKCHFPVDTTFFKSDQSIREDWRERLKLNKKEIAIVYTGRFSLQKNVVRLLREFAVFWKVSPAPVKFFLAGGFDELGAPLMGINFRNGFFYQYWQNQFNQLPKSFRKRVHYLGNLNSSDLLGVSNAADVYASLSLHHDEDYGMSPAETLCCGTPLVLSSWGGYASFNDGSRDCMLVPVKITERGLSMSSRLVQKGLLLQSLADQNPEQRLERAMRASKRLSIEAAAEILLKIHSEKPLPFMGFNNLMIMYAQRFVEGKPYQWDMKPGGLYEKIYSNYI